MADFDADERLGTEALAHLLGIPHGDVLAELEEQRINHLGDLCRPGCKAEEE